MYDSCYGVGILMCEIFEGDSEIVIVKLKMVCVFVIV